MQKKEVRKMVRKMGTLNPEQEQIITYLKRAIRKGKRYFKSRHIGEDLSLSARCVGANMKKLQMINHGLVIREWSASSGVTWLVEARA